MNKYLLLRNNEQQGPYTLEELKKVSLASNDLVWIVGKSEGWTYAGDINELVPFVTQTPEAEKVFHLRSSQPTEPVLETKYNRPLDEIKQLYVHHLTNNGKTRKYKAALIGAIAAVLFLSVLLIVKMNSKPKEVQIKAATTPPPASSEPITNSQNFQNALSKEFVPIETKPKKLKPKDLKKMVAVEMNDYHVKLFGGINDLQLNVRNYSDRLIDKVIIKVDYMKPKGEVVNSETIIVNSIKPQDSKVVDVPPSKRGVKVKATIVDVSSQELSANLEEI